MDLQEANMPREWFCPITQDLMTDPVIASDGFTYERKALQEWFKRSNHSPLTGAVLANINIIPNHALRQTIEQFVEKLKKENPAAMIPKIKDNANLPKVNYDLPDLAIEVDSAVDEDQLYVRCLIKPPQKPKHHRNPCSFICILDVSESMDTDSVMGGKDVESHGFSRLDLVKHSINTMVEFLEDSDQIALVPFSTSARIALPLTRTTKAGKNTIRQKTKELTTIGTTNIWDGFKVSIDILKHLHESQKNHNVFVVLLTDGEPNLNPPRGIVPTLIKFLDLENLPTPNIHVFGYGYELDTNLLTQIAEVGYGTYTYIPDCSMVGTAFVNFMATAVSTITNDLMVKLQDINPKCELKQIVGFKKSNINTYNLGVIQYGQNRQIVLKLPSRVLNIKNQIDKVGTLVVGYGKSTKVTSQQIKLQDVSHNEDSMKQSIIRCKYLGLLSKLMKTKKSSIASSYKEVDQFTHRIQLIDQKQSSQLTHALLKELKNPASENEGQVSKSFEKQEWFQKWGKHYIPSLFRAHIMQTCTNFKDPALQLYGGSVFEQNRTTMDTIFIKMPPPQPTAKKVEKLVYKPAPVDMSDYYNYGGGCIHGDCLVAYEDGTFKPIKQLRKGDRVRGGIVKCVVSTKVFNWIEMVKIEGLIITPWHPIKINGKWVFPTNANGGHTCRIFIESYYNFVMEDGVALQCQGIQCIALGHNINNNPVTAHSYFSKNIVSDLSKSRGWQNGTVEIKGLIRDIETQQVVGVQLD